MIIMLTSFNLLIHFYQYLSGLDIGTGPTMFLASSGYGHYGPVCCNCNWPVRLLNFLRFFTCLEGTLIMSIHKLSFLNTTGPVCQEY